MTDYPYMGIGKEAKEAPPRATEVLVHRIGETSEAGRQGGSAALEPHR